MDKIVLVTGASRGIGAATARLLGKQRYNVCVNYLTSDANAVQVVGEIVAGGGSAFAHRADVANEEEVVELFDMIEQRFGTLTHLVNNAGIVLPQTRLADMTAARINQMLTTNVTSCFLCCREAVRRMRPGGAIVNVSSAAARIGSPGDYIDYAASKGAIDTLTRGLALEVAADNIRVNCVRPGLIYTDIHRDGGEPDRVDRLGPKMPLKRGGTAEEVASAIAWLLSDEASYATGAFLDIAGGR